MGHYKANYYRIRFNKVAKKSLIGFDIIQIESHLETVNIANLARTILDGINYNNRYPMLPGSYAWIKMHLNDAGFLRDLIALAAESVNNNAILRICYYLEQHNVPKNILQPLQKKLKPTKDLVSLIPNGSRKGKADKK